MQFSLNEYLYNLGTDRAEVLLGQHGDNFNITHSTKNIGTRCFTVDYPKGSQGRTLEFLNEATVAYKASTYFAEALTAPEREACILESITDNLFRNNRGDFIHIPDQRGEPITLFFNKHCTLGYMHPNTPQNDSFEEYRRWRQEVSFFKARLQMEARLRLEKSPEHISLVLEALTFEPDSPHIDTLFESDLLEHGYHAEEAYDLIELWRQCT